MEAAIKLARQYWWETNNPQRKYFIARRLSYHGNTLGALALGNHPGRRAPYEVVLEHDAFQHVSPVYYKRFAKEGESEKDYVTRLAQELEGKFQVLGPENVAACESIFAPLFRRINSSSQMQSLQNQSWVRLKA